MEKLVSSWSDGKTLPESYIFPPEKRPGNQLIPLNNTVPLIDLGQAEGDDHAKVVNQIMEAAHEFGFFQIINHGVPTKLMDDTRSMTKDFFELPTDEKTGILLREKRQKCGLLTSNLDYENEKVHNWRDTLRLICTPLEECIHYWPQQPPGFRGVLGEYVVKIRELGSRILELICEGLGLEPGYFESEVSKGQVLTPHYYPPCPDPSLTLGTRKHCDPGLLTILLQGNVPGLQVLKDGEWIGVEAIPNAFVVNIGHQLQIISNGKLISSEHRAVTNKSEARITAAFFMEPTKECIVEPAKAIVNNGQNPAIYKSVRYGEFLQTYMAAYAEGIDDVLKLYKIEASS